MASSDSISSPACVPGSVAVGAVYAANVGELFTSVCDDTSSAADKVACFSNSSSLLTLWAPGVNITAAGVTMSGTSQATPHVAGAIALIAADYPNALPDAIVTRLTTSKTTITDSRNHIARPRLDLVSALAAPAPTGKVVINGGAEYTKSTTVNVDVTTTTGTATQVCLSITTACSAWKTYAPTISWALPAGDGAKTVYVWWKNADGAASASPTSSSITLDTTAPTNGTLTSSLSGTTATLTWSGFKDTGSGVASYQLVSATAAAPKNCSTGTQLFAGSALTFRATSLPTGTTYFRVCAIDNVGNVSTGATASATVSSTRT
jgi:subtilisin family serine protease